MQKRNNMNPYFLPIMPPYISGLFSNLVCVSGAGGSVQRWGMLLKIKVINGYQRDRQVHMVPGSKLWNIAIFVRLFSHTWKSSYTLYI